MKYIEGKKKRVQDKALSGLSSCLEDTEELQPEDPAKGTEKERSGSFCLRTEYRIFPILILILCFFSMTFATFFDFLLLYLPSKLTYLSL